MKIVMETLQLIRSNLRMTRVPISGPSYIYGDNILVIRNNQSPESTLKKKSNSICYHSVRKPVTVGESLTGHDVTNKKKR